MHTFGSRYRSDNTMRAFVARPCPGVMRSSRRRSAFEHRMEMTSVTHSQSLVGLPRQAVKSFRKKAAVASPRFREAAHSRTRVFWLGVPGDADIGAMLRIR